MSSPEIGWSGTVRLVLDFIKANDRDFRDKIKPGTLVQFQGKLLHLFDKEVVQEKLPKLTEQHKLLQHEETWLKDLRTARLNIFRVELDSYYMLLDRKPAYIAFPTRSRKNEHGSFTTYVQLWEALWNEKVVYLYIHMNLGTSIDRYLKIVEE